MDIIKNILLWLNSDPAPVVTADQPVYALGKQIQWMYPEIYGEHHLLMMLGALHIEMAFLDAIGDWLEGSGWIEILVKAQINSPGRAESFLSGKQVKRTRYTHQVSCAGLYLLLQNAHLRSNSGHPLQKLDISTPWRITPIQVLVHSDRIGVNSASLGSKCSGIELWYVCECPWTDCTMDVLIRPYQLRTMATDIHQRPQVIKGEASSDLWRIQERPFYIEED